MASSPLDRPFIPNDTEDPTWKTLSRKDFEITANSNVDQLEVLFDGNKTTTYTTNSPRPHTITITLLRPHLLKYISFFRGDEGSYTPSRVSVQTFRPGGSVIDTKSWNTPKVKGWCHIPLPCQVIKKIIWSIEENHSSGRDSKIKLMSLAEAVPVLEVLSSERHESMTNMDFEMLSSEQITVTDGKNVKESASRFMMMTQFPKLFESEKDSVLRVPYGPIATKCILAWISGDKVALRVEADKLVPQEKKTPLYVPHIVFADLGGISVLYQLARQLVSAPLIDYCEDMLVQIVTESFQKFNSEKEDEDEAEDGELTVTAAATMLGWGAKEEKEETEDKTTDKGPVSTANSGPFPPATSTNVISRKTLDWLCSASPRLNRLVIYGLVKQKDSESLISGIDMFEGAQLQSIFESVVESSTRKTGGKQ